MSLYRPSELRAFAKEYGVHAKKRLSQHFLIDGNILGKMLDVAEIEPGDEVLEIGPGPGVLTEALLKRGAYVLCIEKDALLASALSRLSTQNNLKVITGDVLKISLPSFNKKIKVVANLPYKITTPILERFLPLNGTISSLTLMVQKEVGLRLAASAKSSDYSRLSLFARYYSDPTYCFSIKPQSFSPPPKVTSCVVHFHLKARSIEPTAFFTITKRAFQQKRKMLRSSLKTLIDPGLIEKTLVEMGHLVTARPQDLSLEEFAFLSDCLKPPQSKTDTNEPN